MPHNFYLKIIVKFFSPYSFCLQNNFLLFCLIKKVTKKSLPENSKLKNYLKTPFHAPSRSPKGSTRGALPLCFFLVFYVFNLRAGLGLVMRTVFGLGCRLCQQKLRKKIRAKEITLFMVTPVFTFTSCFYFFA